MRSRLCRACKDFHDVEQPWPVECASHFASHATGSGPFVIPDGMDETKSMADGKTYDSRSAYYRSLNAQGYEIVGNDSSFRDGFRPNHRMPRAGHDIKRALESM